MKQRHSGRVMPGVLAVVAVLALVFSGQGELHAQTLKAVKDRGSLNCGVSKGLAGFSEPDDKGQWRGFDVDFCRAVAAALFGDDTKVTYLPLNALERFEALSSGRVDLLSRNTTWTLARDVEEELEFVGVSYYDGQGFMVPVDKGLSSALQLGGAKVCILQGSTSVGNAERYFGQNDIKAEIIVHEKRDEIQKDYESGKCDAISGDRSALASQRTKTATPADHMLLPEVISKEPLGPVVRQNDPEWSELVRWVLFLLVNAEEVGWDSANAANKSANSAINVPESVNKRLRLDGDWTGNVIRLVGNYGEIFERNVGKDSPLKLERGINALWTQGGILYAPPMR